MNGYQISFFATQSQRIDNQPVADWLLSSCKSLGVRGATVIAAAEGLDNKGHLHSAGFFDMTDVPMQVLVVATQEQAGQLLAQIDQQPTKVFYVKTAVEFGTVGGKQ